MWWWWCQGCGVLPYNCIPLFSHHSLHSASTTHVLLPSHFISLTLPSIPYTHTLNALPPSLHNIHPHHHQHTPSLHPHHITSVHCVTLPQHSQPPSSPPPPYHSHASHHILPSHHRTSSLPPHHIPLLLPHLIHQHYSSPRRI